MIYHLSANLKAELATWVPNALLTAFSFGFVGVPIFFVLSGFVISLSVGDSKITPEYTGKFALKRSFRLDPTYWVAILISIFLLFLKNQMLTDDIPFPSPTSILAHLFYLQDLLSYQPISTVYWTLCLEIQLYIFYILSLGACQKISDALHVCCNTVHNGLIFTTGFYSLTLDHNLLDLNINGIFLPYWHYFVLGVLANNALRGKPYGNGTFILWIITEVLFQSIYPLSAFAITGIATALFIYIAGIQGRLNILLSNQLLQYLGKISYTLYIIHPDIGWKVISLCRYLLGEKMGPLVSASVLFVAVIASVIAAHLLHIIIEKPTMMLGARLISPPPKQIFKPGNIKK